MTFKRLRYNLLVIGLIALVFCYIGMSVFLAKDNSSPNPGNASEADDPFGDNDPGDGDIDEPPIVDDPDEQVSIPTDPYKLANYALSLLETGKGFESTYTSTLTNKAAGVTATQNVSGNVARGVNSKGESVFYEENFYYSNAAPPADSMVANDFKGFYTNLATGMTQVALTKDYSYENKTYNLANGTNVLKPTEQVLEEYKLLQGQGFPLSDMSNATLTDVITKNNYKTLTFTYDISKLPQEYIDFYTSSGQMVNVNYSKISIKLKINTRNGHLYALGRTEQFTATALNVPVLGNIGFTAEVSTTQVFNKMNADLVLKDSL